MKLGELSKKIEELIAEKGFGGETVSGVLDFSTIFVERGDKVVVDDVEYCKNCKEFHLVLKAKEDDKYS